MLLETKPESISFYNRKYVSKPLFGREGENTSIIFFENTIEEKNGEYGRYRKVFQEYYEMPKDKKGLNYQAGLFIANEVCGLGFRRDRKLIMENCSEFAGHYII